MPTIDRQSTPSDDQRVVVVVRGGPPIDPTVLRSLPTDRYVIAADEGYDHCVAAGLAVDEVIGDLDSLSPLHDLDQDGIVVLRLERDKEATDLEVALERACNISSERGQVLVVGGAGWGDRVDHLFAQIGLLASPRWSTRRITALFGSALVTAAHAGQRIELDGIPGELVTLLPVGGPAHGVCTAGMRFPLHGETLDPYATRGVSNEFLDEAASVRVDSGVILVIQPRVRVDETGHEQALKHHLTRLTKETNP